MKTRYLQWIDTLGLQPHPEGGHYREMYRSSDVLPRPGLPSRFRNDRNACTSIYYLLGHPETSRFHRILSDEIWHHYEGSAVLIHMIGPDGGYSLVTLGTDPGAGETPQAVVPYGRWFAAEIRERDGYALMGCTVSPGFDFEDFELADRNRLTAQCPGLHDLISRLC